MVKHLDTGGFLIPGHSTVHPSLASLVAFHQQQPLRPYQELLTQACGQVSGDGLQPRTLQGQVSPRSANASGRGLLPNKAGGRGLSNSRPDCSLIMRSGRGLTGGCDKCPHKAVGGA